MIGLLLSSIGLYLIGIAILYAQIDKELIKTFGIACASLAFSVAGLIYSLIELILIIAA